MKENMPGTHGWVDRGPRIGTWPFDDNGAYNPQNGYSTPSFVEPTITQGRQRPRRLTLVESRLAARNRKIAYEEAQEFERWASTEHGARKWFGFQFSDEFVPEEEE